MDSLTLYGELRKSEIKGFAGKMHLVKAMDAGLSYRTARTLTSLLSYEDTIPEGIVNTLLSPDFYTMENMLRAVDYGLTDLVPEAMFQDSEFLRRSGITMLPDYFLADDEFIFSFRIMPEIKAVGRSAFRNCTALCDIPFPNTVKAIGRKAFYNTDIRKAVINGIKVLEEQAFALCANLRQVAIPENITTIPCGCFKKDSSLRTFHAGDRLAVKKEAFYGCRRLKISEGTLISSLGENAFNGCRELGNMTLDTPEIPEGAFLGCRSMKSLAMMRMPYEIGYNAFYGCESLHDIVAKGYRYQLNAVKGAEAFIENAGLDENGHSTNHIDGTMDIHEALNALIF